MNLKQVMGRLERLGTDLYKTTWPRHGVKPPLFGVKYADLYALQRTLGTDHALALQLFDTGNHDARILATLIVDPAAITSRRLDAWIRVADNQILNDAVSGVAGRSPHAGKKADTWRKVKGEWKSAAGWNVISSMATPDTDVPDGWLTARLDEIEKGIKSAPNRTRHCMNQALISIGGYRPALQKKAIAAAKRIGKVEVDHGITSCKTPDAVRYIEKMAKRSAGKKKKPAARR
ncbi:MAG: DNA alkylation repair protein [Planctomycetota bacterium]|jgi:3-methyladenine DNA glycosylase AlkD